MEKQDLPRPSPPPYLTFLHTAVRIKETIGYAEETMDKVRLEQLKEKNRAFVRRKTWEEHELFQDCIRSLGEVRLIEGEEEIRGLIHSMCGRFPFDEDRHMEGARPAAGG